MESDGIKKVCPLDQQSDYGYCLRNKCAWWVRQKNGKFSTCAVTRIAYLLDRLEYEVVHRQSPADGP